MNAHRSQAPSRSFRAAGYNDVFQSVQVRDRFFGGLIGRPYGEGLVALFERRFEDAVARAQAAFAKDSALYEARLLEGEARLGLAQEGHRRGEQQQNGLSHDHGA